MDLTVGHNSYLTNKWLVKPLFEFKFDYHPEPKNKSISDADKISTAIGLDSLYNHGIGKTPSALIFGVKVYRSTKLSPNHNTYLSPYRNDNVDRHDEEALYLRYLKLSVGEKIYLTDYDTASLTFGVVNFDGFSEELNGQQLSVDFDYSKKIKPRYELGLSVGYDSRDTKKSSGNLKILRGKIQFDTHKVADIYTLLAGVRFSQIEFGESSRSQLNGTELRIAPELCLKKELSEESTINLKYMYENQTSDNSEREYDKHELGVGIDLKF